MRALSSALLLLLATCGKPAETPNDLDALDRELTAADGPAAADPAVRQALRDPIMVDPGLQQQSNANAVRPPDRPDPGAVPPDIARADPVDHASLRHAPPPAAGCPQCRTKAGAYTLGALAAAQPATGRCGAIGYSAAWANRLPADLPLYPDARVGEAAGSASGPCALRAVSFVSSAPPAKLIDWYYTRATAARYSAEHRGDGTTQVLGGTRGNDAFVVYVTPRPGGGSDVDLVTNAGR